MDRVLARAALVAGLAGCIGLSACEQSKSEATEATPAPAHKKLLSRPAPMYAGQEDILALDKASVSAGKDGLLLKADGQAAGAGYTHATFLPRINVTAPADGIYDVDVVADRPGGEAAQAAQPISVKGQWAPYPAGTLKGVRFYAKNNSVVAMLPQG